MKTENPDELVVVEDAPTSPSEVRALDAELRKRGTELELLREDKRQAAEAVAAGETNVKRLAALQSGEIAAELKRKGLALGAPDAEATRLEPLLPPAPGAAEPTRKDMLGRALPSGRGHELVLQLRLLAKSRQGLVRVEREIKDKEAEIGRATAERDAVQMQPLRDLQSLARGAVTTAARLGRALEEAGAIARELLEEERVLWRLMGTQRAENALSLASLKERLSYAIHGSGAFEVDPDRPGLRGHAVFFAVPPINPTHAWRGKSLEEICEGHYALLIREVARGR